MSISENQVLQIAEQAIDSIGELLDRGFTESEEAEVAILLSLWIQRQGCEVKPSEERD